MIISCTNCDSKFSVDDSKIKGKRFGFNCPKCGSAVEFDNRENIRKTVEEEPLPAAFDDGFEDMETSAPGEVQGTDMENEESLNMQDMDMSGLEGLGEISEEGETAADAMYIPSDENTSPEEKTATDTFDFDIEESSDELKDDLSNTFADELEDVAETELSEGVENEENLLDDFSPLEIEDDSSGVKGAGKVPDEEQPIGDEAAESILSDTESILSDTESILSDVKTDSLFNSEDNAQDEDEDITIDLDSLDIQLEEDVEGVAERLNTEELSDSLESMPSESIEIMDLEGDRGQEKVSVPAKENKKADDDEDITLDLDALDLTLDEVEELKEGEALDLEDERISLSDAGLTADELVKGKDAFKTGMEDEDIRLSIDEVPLEEGVGEEIPDTKLTEEDLELELDIDKFDENEDEFLEEKEDKIFTEDDTIADIRSRRDFLEHEAGIDSPDSDIRDTVPRGMISFSVDYSLKFSRLGAFFRLICLYPLILIPHFVVFMVYFAVSSVLSFFNCLIILFSGTHEENFIEFQENTVRYFLSLSACIIDIVEETPKFAGRKDIDYSLQYDATYPIRYSRVLAFLRLTVIGILIAALPHIILLLIMSIGSLLICLIGIISIIIRRKWPNVLFEFMTRYYRYLSSVLSYITGIVDRYPSFKFE